jgi:hypothetical protein
MKPIAIAVLLISLAAVSHAATIALGVSAVAPNEVIVKIDGRDSHVRLSGVKPSGDPAAASFLRCLVAGRVLRVQPSSGGTAKITMLDGSIVADLVNEYFDTTTKIDPCALGKAAYQPKPLHPVEATAAETTPAGATSTKRTVNWSIPSSPAATAQPTTPFRMPAEVKFPERQAEPATAPKSPDVATVDTPTTIQPYIPGQSQMAPPGTASTTPVEPGGTSAVGAAGTSTVQPLQPYTPPVTPQKPPRE